MRPTSFALKLLYGVSNEPFVLSGRMQGRSGDIARVSNERRLLLIVAPGYWVLG